MRSKRRIPFVYIACAFSKVFFLWMALAPKSYLQRAKYRYPRKVYFQFLSNSMRHRLPNFLPRESSSIDLSWEIKKRLIIYLIEFGKFSSTQICEALIDCNVTGVTNKVVEDIFWENRNRFENLPKNYLNNFSETKSDDNIY